MTCTVAVLGCWYFKLTFSVLLKINKEWGKVMKKGIPFIGKHSLFPFNFFTALLSYVLHVINLLLGIQTL